MTVKPKIFISHAWEDKKDIVDPLAEALHEYYDVWLDTNKLRPGDSIRAQISKGLAEADFGIVILSKAFFSKYWTQAEYGALTSLESTERKVTIPVRWKVSIDEIKKIDPLSADRIIIDGEKPVDQIVDSIRLATDSARRAVEYDRKPNLNARLAALDQRIEVESKARQLATSLEGSEKADLGIRILKTKVVDFARSFTGNSIGFTPEELSRGIGVFGPNYLAFLAVFHRKFTNSLDDSHLCFSIYRRQNMGSGEGVERSFVEERWLPWFNANEELIWRLPNRKDDGKLTESLVDHMLERFIEVVEKHHGDSV